MADKSTHKLARLFAPRSIAFVGGTIASMAIRRSVDMGYRGEIWPVNPNRESMEGFNCFTTVRDLPSAPDAVHVDVNRHLTIDIVRDLAAIGAGGAVCYAAGFAEMGDEGRELERKLIEAAGDMPLVGPNTFGFLNFVERCSLWPYLFGCAPVDRGVALVSQSGNIAMNLTMNDRSVNFTHVIGTGNQSVLGPGDYIDALLLDDRVRAIGMYIEGLDDIPHFSSAAARALEQGVPIVVMKVGRTEASARQSSSHTSSLTGSDVLHDTLFRRLGVIRVNSLNQMLETLKLLDLAGPLTGKDVLSLSCSGGEASIMADLADATGLRMSPFSDRQMEELEAQFENYVTVSNPFDYNTSIWGNGAAQQRCFTSAMSGGHDAAFLVYDHPSVEGEAVAAEVNEWMVALDAFIAAHRQTGMPAFVVSTVNELLPVGIRDYLADNGVVPLQGFEDALSAYALAADYHEYRSGKAGAVVPPRAFHGVKPGRRVLLDEWESKQLLRSHGLEVPEALLASGDEAPAAARQLGFPVVVKAFGEGFAHKTELDAVRLGLGSEAEVARAVKAIRESARRHGRSAERFIVERMVTGAVAELLVGIKCDEQFGPALVIGAGGQLVELISDSASLLLPVSRSEISAAIDSLLVSRMLRGFRGSPPGDIEAVIDVILAVSAFAEDHWDQLLELDINPLMVLPRGRGAVAVDALISNISE